MTLLLILLVVAAAVIGWYGFEGRWDRRLFGATSDRSCSNIRPREARVFLETYPETQVLDVRSTSEFKNGALPNAIHISVGDPDFERRIAELDRAKPVLVYCAGGFRSRKAVAILKSQGFKNIQHLHRGWHSWRFAGLPVGDAADPGDS